MRMIHADECSCERVEMEGAKGLVMQWLLDERCGAGNFAMRRFVIEPGGCTPRHSHPWEHEVFIVSGVGEVAHGDSFTGFATNSAILVEADEPHQFRNTGVEPLEFICLVPNGPATENLPE